jgi:hypothetical protein
MEQPRRLMATWVTPKTMADVRASELVRVLQT